MQTGWVKVRKQLVLWMEAEQWQQIAGSAILCDRKRSNGNQYMDRFLLGKVLMENGFLDMEAVLGQQQRYWWSRLAVMETELQTDG